MKRHAMFYAALGVLVILDSVLLTSPNLLGKIGLIIYKYHYLRTFPRAFVTVLCVVLIALGIATLIQWLVRRHVLRRVVGIFILLALILACAALWTKTWMDFSAWTYSHTGTRFRYGAYLLPIMLLIIFIHALINLHLSSGSPVATEPPAEDAGTPIA